jgi:hypothetical protein
MVPTATRSPGAKPVTAAPTAVTVPVNSWPGTRSPSSEKKWRGSDASRCGRHRILGAATEEFAERGVAGARIDRIIAAARTNKAQLYGYSGSKDGLFDAVIAMACAWSPGSGVIVATAGEPAADHDRRRALLCDCVRRAVAP